MINKNEWLVVGLITSPHGLNGEVKVKSLSDFEERFTKNGKRWIQKDDKNPIEYKLKSGFRQPGKNIYIVTFKGINNRDQAEKLRQQKILVRVDDLPELKDEEFHVSELINLEVKILKEDKLIKIGKVIDLENEKNNLLVIKLLENHKKILIPFVKQIVPLIDRENKYILIDPPKGLLEL